MDLLRDKIIAGVQADLSTVEQKLYINRLLISHAVKTILGAFFDPNEGLLLYHMAINSYPQQQEPPQILSYEPTPTHTENWNRMLFELEQRKQFLEQQNRNG